LIAASTRSAFWVDPLSTSNTPSGPAETVTLAPAPPIRKMWPRTGIASSGAAACCADSDADTTTYNTEHAEHAEASLLQNLCVLCVLCVDRRDRDPTT
jgi:hypothetical protein